MGPFLIAFLTILLSPLFGCAGATYALLKYFLKAGGSEAQVLSVRRRKKGRENGRFDGDLPLLLEQEYGSFRQLCLEADPLGAGYLEEIPDHFFAFPQNFFKFI